MAFSLIFPEAKVTAMKKENTARFIAPFSCAKLRCDVGRCYSDDNNESMLALIAVSSIHLCVCSTHKKIISIFKGLDICLLPWKNSFIRFLNLQCTMYLVWLQVVEWKRENNSQSSPSYVITDAGFCIGKLEGLLPQLRFIAFHLYEALEPLLQ